MPSSGVIKPKILSNNIEDNYVWEVTQGLISLFPSFLEGENIINLGYSIDRAFQLYNVKNLERIDKRHASVNNYASLNGNELNERLEQMGIPYIKNDTSVGKKNRLKNWWKKNFGGGTETSIKSILYDFIGSGVFFPFDEENTDSSLTKRILIKNPSAGGQWGDYDISLQYIDWSDYYASSGSGGSWGDVFTVGKSDMDIQIKFGSIIDYYQWNFDKKKADTYYLTEEIKPLGLIYTLSFIYDGKLSDCNLWYKFDKGGKDEKSVLNFLDQGFGVIWSSGIINGSMITTNGYLSGTLNKDVMSGTDMTISFWFKVISDNSSSDTIIDTSNNNINIYATTDWSSGISGYIGQSSTEQSLTSFDFSDNSWHNVIITAVSGTGITTYIDNGSGTLVSNGFSDVILLSGTDVVFGRMYSGGNHGDFEIEEFMLFERVITSTERAEIYQAGEQFIS